MHIIMNRKTFLKALKEARPVAKMGKWGNPIVKDQVRLSVAETALMVWTTNLDTHQRLYEPIEEIKRVGRCVMPIGPAIKALSARKEQLVEIEAEGVNIKLRMGDLSLSLKGHDPEEYPMFPSLENAVDITVDAQGLLEDLRKVVNKTAKETGRYALNGVFLEYGKGRLQFCGTDGWRLGYAVRGATCHEHVYGEALLSADFCLRARKALAKQTCAVLLKLTPDEESGSDRGWAWVYGDRGGSGYGVEICSKQVDGQFPDWRSVIPKSEELTRRCSISRDALMETLSALLSVEPKSMEWVGHRFCFEPGVLRVHHCRTERVTVQNDKRWPGGMTTELVWTDDVSSSSEVRMEYQGDPVSIGLDVLYMRDALDAFPAGEPVTLEFQDANRGIILHAGSRETGYQLVMPLFVYDRDTLNIEESTS